MTLEALKALYETKQFEAYQKVCEAAWALVRPYPWKAPVGQFIPRSYLAQVKLTPEVVAHAVTHFTATECKVVETPHGYEFTAAGYWAGPAC